MAGAPDAVDQQIQRLRAQTGINEDQTGPGIDQECRHVVLSAHVPDMGRIAVNGDGVFPVGGKCFLAHAQTACGGSIKEFLFHTIKPPDIKCHILCVI